MDNSILVLGGTGKTGKRVARGLRKLQRPIRIGSRNENPSFNWDEPENWQDVLAGIQQVYITFQPDLAAAHARQKIEQFVAMANEAGVKKLVLLSGRGEKEAAACEQIIIQSALEWVIIRASWFMQNFSEHFFLDAVVSNEVVLPTVKALEPFVDADDIAEVAVKALTDPQYTHHVFELTGPELLSFEGAISMIAQALNRQISYTEISMDEYLHALRSYGLSEDYIWLIQYLFSEVLDGRNQSLSSDIEKILGRRPTTFEEYVVKTAKTEVWQTT